MAKKYYKIVLSLKNGAKVSPFMPKESGLRQTYMANGQAIPVDGGFVFNNIEELCDFYSGYRKDNFEIWECNISKNIKAPKFCVSLPFSINNEAIEHLKISKKLNKGKIKKSDYIKTFYQYSFNNASFLFEYNGNKRERFWEDKYSCFADGVTLIKRRKDLE